ncbi:MAG: hypothetical protein ACWA5P_00285, partial [bacterium]
MTDKTKNSILLAGTLIAFYLVYQLAIAPTFTLKNNYDELSKEAILFEQAPQKLISLSKKNQQLDSVLDVNRISGQSIKNGLLKTLNELTIKHHVEILEFGQTHQFENNGLVTRSYPIKLKGSFSDVLQLVYNLEQETN